MTTLALTLAIPLLGFLLICLLPRDSKVAFPVALTTTVMTFCVSLALIPPVLHHAGNFTSVIDVPWISGSHFDIRFHLGADGLNIWLLLLTTLLLPIGVWISQSMIPERRKMFFGLLAAV